MPIHDQGYRRFLGRRDGRGNSWLVIASTAVRTMLRNRKFLALLVAAWLPFLGHAIAIYLSANFQQVAMLQPTASTFREFLGRWQQPFVFFVTIYVGSGLIANDRRANALQIYLSKPLTRVEYIAGKAAALLVFLLFVTWVPALLLLLVQVMFAGSFAFVQKNLFLFPAITVFSFLQVLVATFAMLALSSLSKSSRFVAVMFAGVIMFTNAVQGMLWLLTRSSAASLLSPSASLNQVGDVVFRVAPRYDTPWALSLGVVVALVAVSLLVLERRVRGVEVVA
jgi:ABC-2 type transport system permease protein